MRIAIDASRTTLARRTGTENYALQLIRALVGVEEAAKHQFTLYFRDAPPSGLFSALPHVQQRVIPFRRAWTHLRFAAAILADRPDVTFVPAHTLPFVFPGRAVVTIHDLGYRYFPEAHPRKERYYLDLTTRYSARRASRILADSEATKRDLTRFYGTHPAKIDVVYPGVEGLQRATSAQIDAVRAKYKLPARYLLFLGTLQPRKNIVRLAQAFARALEISGDADLDLALVFAGKPGWLMDVQHDILPLLSTQAAEKLIFTGYVADEDVAALYSGALALTFPSLYEGFGFPVIEAMRCGTPVLCANTSSLPELAGNAALLVDPMNIEAIAQGITRLAADSALRTELVKRGYDQSQQFLWQFSAQVTLYSIEQALP